MVLELMFYRNKNFFRLELPVQLSVIETETRAMDKGVCMNKGIIHINWKAKESIDESEPQAGNRAQRRRGVTESREAGC